MTRAVASLLALVAFALPPWLARAAPASDVAPLAAAVAAHPDDPDLLRALARALAREGRSAEAAARLRELEARWPDRYADVWLEIGQLAHEAGDDEGALDALARARPSGAAHFFRGLALRRLGRTAEAEQALAVAARLEPALRAESALLRGLDRLATGDTAAARELIEEAVAHDPGGAIGSAARAALSSDAEPRFAQLFASAGFEHDSNVTLDSGTSPLSSRESDERAVWGAGVLLRPLRSETASVVLGYRFQSQIHDDLESYDFDTHSLSAGAGVQVHDRVALRLDGSFASSIRNDDPYLRSVAGLPSVLFDLGPRAGVLRAFAEIARRDYRDEVIVPSLERGGRTFGLGLTQLVPLPWRSGAWSALTVRRIDLHTGAERDLLGFTGDYDNVRYEGSAAAYIPLARGFVLSGSLLLGRERYLNRNLVDALTAGGGVGTADPERRRDTVFETRLALERELGRFVTVEIAWRYAQAISNVDVYDYDRHVLGTYLRTEF